MSSIELPLINTSFFKSGNALLSASSEVRLWDLASLTSIMCLTTPGPEEFVKAIFGSDF